MSSPPVSHKTALLLGLDKFVMTVNLPLAVNQLKMAQVQQRRLARNVEVPLQAMEMPDRLFIKIAESRDFDIFEERP